MPYCCATLISASSADTAGDSRTSANSGARRNQDLAMELLNGRRARSIGRRGRAIERGWRVRSPNLCALVEASQHKFAVAERLGGGEPAFDGAEHHVEKLVARVAHRELPLQQAARVDVDVLAHRAHRARVG